MVQSVELLLDSAAEAAVRAEWAALAASGLPSQALHTAPSNRPHVTLAVAGHIPPDSEQLLPGAVVGLPVPITLGALVVFGGPGSRVLARLVVPTHRMLALHAAVAVAVAGSERPSALTQPGAWTPHVTLARRVADEQLLAALRVLRQVTDLEAEGVAVRRWDGSARREWLVRPAQPWAS